MEMNITFNTNPPHAPVVQTNKLTITSIYSDEFSQNDHQKNVAATNMEIDYVDNIITTGDPTSQTPVYTTPCLDAFTSTVINNNDTNRMESQNITHEDQLTAPLLNQNKEHFTQNDT